MNFNDLLKKLFGNKSQRDLKEIQPWVDKVKAVYPAIEKLSNDELRARTQAIMQGLQDSVAADRKKIDELKAGVESLEVEKREAVWNEIDKIKKNVLETLEKGLMDALPEVFAIVKNTGYRFANNETVVVTATDMDRELAATKDFVTIDGDKAIYNTTWSAGGNPVHWDMVHYDVQLFGGVVLHKGKIAEMATGEGKTLVATLPVFLNALTHNGVHVVTASACSRNFSAATRFPSSVVTLSLVSFRTLIMSRAGCCNWAISASVSWEKWSEIASRCSGVKSSNPNTYSARSASILHEASVSWSYFHDMMLPSFFNSGVCAFASTPVSVEPINQ